jgi:hypothetical protein
MINKAVYTFLAKDKWNDTCGYSTLRDCMDTTTLSVLVSKGHFDRIEFVTDDFGKQLFLDKIKLPIECNTILNEYTWVPKIWWGYYKIIAYSIQKEPFVHLDNDAILWDGIPKDMQEAPLFFQSIETPFIDGGGYGWYIHLLETAKRVPFFPEIVKNNPVDYSFNCGLVGGNNLDIFQEWRLLSESYMFAQQNKEFFTDKNNLLIHQNLLAEQFFIASLTNSKGLKLNEDIKFIIDYKNLFESACEKGHRFTHLWGTIKREKDVIKRVYARLKKDYPIYYDRIMKLNILDK